MLPKHGGMQEKQNLVMVEYLNTLPFKYGLTQFKGINDLEIEYENPKNCFSKFSTGHSDIALVPIGGLLTLDSNHYNIFGDYCIGCDGEVSTVCLYHKGSIKNLKKVYLDSESQTSVLLVQVLLKKYYGINAEFLPLNKKNEVLRNNESVLLIGDKVFNSPYSSEKCLDLGEEWKKMTGLPFVFAVWVCNPNVSEKIRNELNDCFAFGVSAIDNMLKDYNIEENKRAYFKNYIDYNYDDKKKISHNKFKDLVDGLNLMK